MSPHSGPCWDDPTQIVCSQCLEVPGRPLQGQQASLSRAPGWSGFTWEQLELLKPGR